MARGTGRREIDLVGRWLQPGPPHLTGLRGNHELAALSSSNPAKNGWLSFPPASRGRPAGNANSILKDRRPCFPYVLIRVKERCGPITTWYTTMYKLHQGSVWTDPGVGRADLAAWFENIDDMTSFFFDRFCGPLSETCQAGTIPSETDAKSILNQYRQDRLRPAEICLAVVQAVGSAGMFTGIPWAHKDCILLWWLGPWRLPPGL